MNNPRILISGAGIAGLTLATLLKQYGFTPTLVEKHHLLRTEGYKLDIRGVAVDVIQRMGLHSAIAEARTQIQQAIFVDDKGRKIATTLPDFCCVRSGEDLEIVRGDLCRILYESMGEVECLFGDSITSITQCETEVRVEFNHHPRRSFDLVIGADGLHSTVRNLVFGEERQFLRELGLYASFYSIPNYLQLNRVEIEYFAPKRFAIAYCPQDGAAKAGFAFSADLSHLDLREKSVQKSALKEAFVSVGWEVPRLLAYMDQSPDFYFDCMAQIHMPRWSKGRVAVVGDAAYAVSPIAGQGASVSLVGAYVLAGEIAKAQGDFTKAFASYEETLREFIRQNQQLANMNVALMKESGLLRLMLYLGRLLPGSLIRFFKYLGLRKTRKAARAVMLKHYLKEGLGSGI